MPQKSSLQPLWYYSCYTLGDNSEPLCVDEKGWVRILFAKNLFLCGSKMQNNSCGPGQSFIEFSLQGVFPFWKGVIKKRHWLCYGERIFTWQLNPRQYIPKLQIGSFKTKGILLPKNGILHWKNIKVRKKGTIFSGEWRAWVYLWCHFFSRKKDASPGFTLSW